MLVRDNYVMRAVSFRRALESVFLCAILAGCQTTTAVKTPAATELVAPEKALIMPPPGGLAMVGVVANAYGNGVEQTVWLATSSSVIGQNYLKIRYNGGSAAETGSLGYKTITESSLRSERISAIPGVRLTVSNNFLRNAYGPIGYASGKSAAGDTCLFGWQQIRSRPTGSGMGRDFGMIQVRARLCDRTASERELLNFMYGYTITGTFQGQIWNPYGAPAPVPDSFAYVGQQVLPPADVVPASYSFGYRPQVPVVTRTPVRREPLAPVVAPAAPEPRPVTVIVPGPIVPGPGPALGAGPALQPQMAPSAAATRTTPTAAVAAPPAATVAAPAAHVPSPHCLDPATAAACAANNK